MPEFVPEFADSPILKRAKEMFEDACKNVVWDNVSQDERDHHIKLASEELTRTDGVG